MNCAKLGASDLFRMVWPNDETNSVYVSRKMLESKAKSVLDNWNKMDVLKIRNFLFVAKSEVSDGFKTDEEMKLILDYLISIKNCDICTIDNVVYIKFTSSSESDVRYSDQDINLLRLHILNKKLTQEVNNLEKSVLDLKSKVKELLRDGSKSQARLQLKRMKRLQNTLDKKLIILENVDVILQNVETASEQVEVVRAYKAGLEALKKEFGRSDNKDEVLELVEDIKYYTDEVTEISHVISGESSLNNEDLISDSELEEELEVLLSNETISSDDQLLKTLNNLKVVNEDPIETTQEIARESNNKLNISSTSECC